MMVAAHDFLTERPGRFRLLPEISPSGSSGSKYLWRAEFALNWDNAITKYLSE